MKTILLGILFATLLAACGSDSTGTPWQTHENSWPGPSPNSLCENAECWSPGSIPGRAQTFVDLNTDAMNLFAERLNLEIAPEESGTHSQKLQVRSSTR